MEWYEILLILIALIIIIYVLIIVFSKIRYRNILKAVTSVINNQYPNANIITKSPEDIYQIGFIQEKEYLIKIIDMNPKHEVIITNSERVVINDDIKGWKRSTKPNFVDGIKDFMKYNNNNELIKIVLLYPSCYNITKYINESDAFKVKEFQEIDSIYYLRFKNLIKFLKKQ
ncbi:MAG: hypothetical protein PQJ44_01170 [Sphaerochaetaceae bacterium]|nr:hypothetical protein [Sphaerochaetaceae bacterium]